MKLLTLGINHHTAPVAIREKVAFDPEFLQEALHDLRQHLVGANHAGLPEATILSTCNRTEVYCAANDPNAENILHEVTFDEQARVKKEQEQKQLQAAKEQEQKQLQDAKKKEESERANLAEQKRLADEQARQEQLKKSQEQKAKVDALYKQAKDLYYKDQLNESTAIFNPIL